MSPPHLTTFVRPTEPQTQQPSLRCRRRVRFVSCHPSVLVHGGPRGSSTSRPEHLPPSMRRLSSAYETGRPRWFSRGSRTTWSGLLPRSESPKLGRVTTGHRPTGKRGYGGRGPSTYKVGTYSPLRHKVLDKFQVSRRFTPKNPCFLRSIFSRPVVTPNHYLNHH